MSREEIICRIVRQLINTPNQNKACCGHFQ